jgi:glycerol-3-phosphate acyltransferase PlsX
LNAKVRVAVDAMGGDNAPAAIVAGALEAVDDNPQLAVVLVGRQVQIQDELAGRVGALEEQVSVVDASEVIGMEEHVDAVRNKRDASINVATRLVAEGKADAVVSAGNSGAIMAAAIFGLRRLKGVDRPAIGGLVPTTKGQAFVLDVGANADVKPEYLYQFALLGDAYARRVLGKDRPSVALLSNGEEEGKGNQVTIEAYELLKSSRLNFTGNIEGKELFKGGADVVVTDGFTGNVMLKTMEGLAEFLLTTIRDEAKKSPWGIAGGLMLKPSIGRIRSRVDWRKVGGALLLGVNGVVIIAHGRSDAEATENAIKRAAEAVDSKVVQEMEAAISPPHPTSSRKQSEEIRAS